MKHHFENHDLVTEGRAQLIDLTHDLIAAVGRAEVANGMALASSSQTIPIVDGALQLGRYQRVFFCELDCSRARKVFVQVIRA